VGKRSQSAGRLAKRTALVGGVAAMASALTVGLAVPGIGATDTANDRAARAAVHEVRLAGLLEDLGLPVTDTQVAGWLQERLSGGRLLQALGVRLPSLDGAFEIPDLPYVGRLPIDITTTSPLFGVAGVLGVNPIWVPALPGAIADKVDAAPYRDLEIDIDVPIPNNIRKPVADIVYNAAYVYALVECKLSKSCREKYANDAVAKYVPTEVGVDLDLGNLRIPILAGIGSGALATGLAYPYIVADLPHQPGGADGEDGASLTILGLVLLRNPGRADGGLAARFAPFFERFGIDTVTPEVAVERSGKAGADGEAVLLPLKIDATFEYDFLSDFAAWPNPYTMANNLAALLFPTYLLRGADLEGVIDVVTGPLIQNIAGNLAYALTETIDPYELKVPLIDVSVSIPVGDLAQIALGAALDVPVLDDYEALNLFATVRTDSLPLLEPLRLPFDVLNLLTGDRYGFVNPFADAIEPALKLLVNLGYTNVVQDMSDPLNPYPRVFTAEYGSEYAPFMTLPEGIVWERVRKDVATALVAGVQHAFFSGGNPFVKGPGMANPLSGIADLIGLSDRIPDFGAFLDRLDRASGPAEPTPAPQSEGGAARGTDEADPGTAPGPDAGDRHVVAAANTADPEPVVGKRQANVSPDAGDRDLDEDALATAESGASPASRRGGNGPRFGNGRVTTDPREVGQKIGDSLRDAVAATAGGVRDLGTKPHKAPQRAAKAEPGDADKAA